MQERRLDQRKLDSDFLCLQGMFENYVLTICTRMFIHPRKELVAITLNSSLVCITYSLGGGGGYVLEKEDQYIVLHASGRDN